MNIADAVRVAKTPALYTTVEVSTAIDALLAAAYGKHGPVARHRRCMAHALIIERYTRRKRGDMTLQQEGSPK